MNFDAFGPNIDDNEEHGLHSGCHRLPEPEKRVLGPSNLVKRRPLGLGGALYALSPRTQCGHYDSVLRARVRLCIYENMRMGERHTMHRMWRA